MAAPSSVRAPSEGRRWWRALAALSIAELREDRDLTPTGLVKWILEPLSYVAVYVVLVQVVFNRSMPDYPLFVLCAVLPWQFFQGVVAGSTGLVQRFAPVIGNRAFPRTVLPASLILKEASTFVLALVLVVPVGVFRGADVSLALLWLPVVVVSLALLSAGPAFIGAVFGVYFPDFRNVAVNLLRVGFLASSALVRSGTVPGDRLPDILRLNPLSGVFDALRAIVMEGNAPTAFQVVYPVLVGAGLLLVGLPLYRWRAPDFAKEL